MHITLPTSLAQPGMRNDGRNPRDSVGTDANEDRSDALRRGIAERLKIDSLAMAEMTMEIERTFAIKVDEYILDVETVNDLVTYVYERQQAQPKRTLGPVEWTGILHLACMALISHTPCLRPCALNRAILRKNSA